MADVTDYDLCIIGGGAAGLVTAAGAAALGAKVILIEQNKLGGDCLYTGCVPSKALIHSAHVAHTVSQASRAGLSAILDSVEQQKVLGRVKDVIAQIEPNDSPERFRELGVEVLFSKAQFIDDATVIADERTITARHFVVATGSRPLIPDITGLDIVDYFTNETIFRTDETIKHLIVVGSGPIACELAQSYARLGAKVSMISQSGLLPREDNDLSAVVKSQFESEQIDLYLDVDVELVLKTDTGLAIQIDNGKHKIIEGSHLLVATGRLANVDGFGLDKAGVDIISGRLKLDSRLRTTNRRIFACGDVAGPYLFTHMAEHQAGVVLRNTLFRLPAKSQERGTPWCTFTSPELARVGLSEQEAREQNKQHEVYCFPFAEIDRAIVDDQAQGIVKIITTPRGKILGASIVGPHAGELIAEFSLAMSAGLSLSALSKTIHLYPSLAQINRRVADVRLKSKLTPFKQRLLKKVFGLRGGK